jgi:hypothetical protein
VKFRGGGYLSAPDTRRWLTGDTPGRLLSDRGAIRDD